MRALRSGGRDDALVFAREGGEEFVPSTVRPDAIKAWEAAELEPITLHECRHTDASLVIAAGLREEGSAPAPGQMGIPHSPGPGSNLRRGAYRSRSQSGIESFTGRCGSSSTSATVIGSAAKPGVRDSGRRDPRHAYAGSRPTISRISSVLQARNVVVRRLPRRTTARV
jgi:hypothetical protein